MARAVFDESHALQFIVRRGLRTRAQSRKLSLHPDRLNRGKKSRHGTHGCVRHLPLKGQPQLKIDLSVVGRRRAERAEAGEAAVSAEEWR